MIVTVPILSLLIRNNPSITIDWTFIANHRDLKRTLKRIVSMQTRLITRTDVVAESGMDYNDWWSRHIMATQAYNAIIRHEARNAAGSDFEEVAIQT